MAGNISIEHLKRVPLCDHGKMCVLKTGTSNSSSRGKSFFICNNVQGRCSFTSAANDFQATTCTLHHELVELRAFANKDNGVRCYYRCVFGKDNRQAWCGHELIKSGHEPVQEVLVDVTNQLATKANRLQSKMTVNAVDKGVASFFSNSGITAESENILPSSGSELLAEHSAVSTDKELPLTVESGCRNKLVVSTQGVRAALALVVNDSDIDMGRTSFNTSRNDRFSEISDTSSADSSSLSTESAECPRVYGQRNKIHEIEPRIEDICLVSDTSNDFHDGPDDSQLVDRTENENIDDSNGVTNGGILDCVNSMSNSSNPIQDAQSANRCTGLNCNFFGSEEFRGMCSTCFLRMTGEETTINANHLTKHHNATSNESTVKQSTSDYFQSFSNKNVDSYSSSNVLKVPQNASLGMAGRSESIAAKLSNKQYESHGLGNIIEISDSSDEETDTVSGCTAEVQQNSSKSNLYIFSTRISSLQKNISRQQEVLTKMGSFMPDKGYHINEHIIQLQEELEIAKKDYAECLGQAKTVHGSVPINVHYPPSVKPAPTSMPDGISYGNVGQQRPAPLFGGRMTEKRLKEVGTITAGSIEQLHKSLDLRPTPCEEADDPNHLKVTLMAHQKQALAWLVWREKQNPSGGILADDMGLGKTLTMISLSMKSKQDDIRQIRESPDESNLLFSNATVIVCPASLVHQWQKEIEKRVVVGNVSVCVYHGQNRERRLKKLANKDIVLTTYSIVGIEGKKFSINEKEKPQNHLSEWIDTSQPKVPELGPLFKVFWRRIILDEGHTIKNHKTGSSIAICALEGESRWIVTGTPIQNNTMELYSLIKFLRVHPFDELKVWKREVDNKTLSGTKRMNSIVASLLLRRTKDQTDVKTGKPLITLPKQSKVLHKLKLSKDESDVYELVQHYSKKVFTKFLDTRKDAVERGISTDFDEQNRIENYRMPDSLLGIDVNKILPMLGLYGASNVVTQGCLLVLVLRLRQCCTHLSLMCEEIDPDTCKNEGIEIANMEDSFANLSIDHGSKNAPTRPKEMLPTFSSSKISQLISCLNSVRKESSNNKVKCVIVSQWSRMLNVVAFHLRQEGFRYDFITGSVVVKKRSDIVEAFNNEVYPEIILLSLKAGGVGLNLIGGNHLFLLDQHWNPALEEQASDRIYRVGQKNDVTVHRFLCIDTVEERIAALQEKKKALANSVLYGDKAVQKLSLQDLKMIFGLMS